MKIFNCDSKRWEISQRTELPHHEWDIGKIYSEDMTSSFSNLTVRLTYFPLGSGNELHTHPNDQVIYITQGVGVVKTKTEEYLVYPGDLVFFPAGELHSHSAAPGHIMEHLSIR